MKKGGVFIYIKKGVYLFTSPFLLVKKLRFSLKQFV